jgi:hypothetical protein
VPQPFAQFLATAVHRENRFETAATDDEMTAFAGFKVATVLSQKALGLAALHTATYLLLDKYNRYVAIKGKLRLSRFLAAINVIPA